VKFASLVVTAVVLACAGCNLLPGNGDSVADSPGAGAVTVNYVDPVAGDQSVEHVMQGLACSTSDGGLLITGDSANSALVLMLSPEGDWNVYVTLKDTDHVFGAVGHANDPGAVIRTADGVAFTETPGVVTAGNGASATVIDDSATASGTYTCG